MSDATEKGFSNYKPEGEITTPYKRARQIWDDRVGDARVQAKNWRLATLVSLVVTLVMTIGLIYQSSKASIKPYVVEVDKFGEVRKVAVVGDERFVPKKAAIHHFLAEFVKKARSVPIDPIVLRDNWIGIYAFAEPRVQTLLTEYMTETNPFARLKSETVTTEVLDINAISKESYDVRWREVVYDSSGTISSDDQYGGIFTISFKAPPNEKMLRMNPLGIYIKSYDWSKKVISDLGETKTKGTESPANENPASLP